MSVWGKVMEKRTMCIWQGGFRWRTSLSGKRNDSAKNTNKAAWKVWGKQEARVQWEWNEPGGPQQERWVGAGEQQEGEMYEAGRGLAGQCKDFWLWAGYVAFHLGSAGLALGSALLETDQSQGSGKREARRLVRRLRWEGVSEVGSSRGEGGRKCQDCFRPEQLEEQSCHLLSWEDWVGRLGARWGKSQTLRILPHSYPSLDQQMI